MVQPAQKRVIHEYGHTGAHRIVIIEQDGRRSEGAWSGYRSFAHHRGFYATSPYWEGSLPIGVFRLNPIPHEVLDESTPERQPP